MPSLKFGEAASSQGQITMGLGPEEEVTFQLRTRYYAELVQLATNFAAGSHRRGVASIDNGLRPEALCQVPDVGVRATCATRQVHFADQESPLQFHQRALGRQLLRFFAQSGTAS